MEVTLSSLKDRCKAVVQLDRAEQAADDAREDLFRAVQRGEPGWGYQAAYDIALHGLAWARTTLDRVKREIRLGEYR